ncbi:pancreatic secretory granule membrane major glycoprotein GP2-like [Aquarana catesbeiana]|uniref:pancreatic secretory granule membrane major glycoprotein GP2-like n=1 Tax=Aquarana catesbeiana TaxID=8400 RepID=UPI003CC94FB6
MSKPLVILLILSSTSVVTFTAGQAPGRSINITVPEMGEFQAIMALYRDSGYTTPYTGSEVALTTGQFLYVGVFFLGGTSNLVLVMKNCYATQTSNVNDTLKYYIIKDSCPNKSDGTITVEENGVSSKGRFSVQICQSRSDEIGTAQSSDGTLTIGLIRQSGLVPPISISPIPTTPQPIPTTPKSGSFATANVSPQICKADEEWQLRNQQYGCFCKDPYKVTDLSQVIPDLTCGLSEMRATFHKCQFNDLSIYFNKSHVKDNACFIFMDDPVTNTFTIRTPLEAVGCGDRSYETNDTHATYKAVITIDVEERNSMITSTNTLRITLLCFYGLDMTASLHPILSLLYRATMALYKDSNYTTPYKGPEVTLSSEEYLYVGVYLHAGVFILLRDTSNFVLVMRNCYGTLTNDVNDPLRYYIIQNSCPKIHDGTLSVEENGVSSQGRFSVQMSKFFGSYDRVYLHCAVSLCNINTGSCRPVCATAIDGSDGTPMSFDPFSVLTIGPIRRSGPFSITTTTTTTPRPFSITTTTTTTPRPFSTTTITTPKSTSSTINSSHIFWILLIPALTILIQSL